jgi:hypothetical protein
MIKENLALVNEICCVAERDLKMDMLTRLPRPVNIGNPGGFYI